MQERFVPASHVSANVESASARGQKSNAATQTPKAGTAAKLCSWGRNEANVGANGTRTAPRTKRACALAGRREPPRDVQERAGRGSNVGSSWKVARARVPPTAGSSAFFRNPAKSVAARRTPHLGAPIRQMSYSPFSERRSGSQQTISPFSVAPNGTSLGRRCGEGLRPRARVRPSLQSLAAALARPLRRGHEHARQARPALVAWRDVAVDLWGGAGDGRTAHRRLSSACSRR